MKFTEMRAKMLEHFATMTEGDTPLFEVSLDKDRLWDLFTIDFGEIFYDWHNDIYLRQSLYNLEEKAMCHGIPADEWRRIYDRFKDFTPLWSGE